MTQFGNLWRATGYFTDACVCIIADTTFCPGNKFCRRGSGL